MFCCPAPLLLPSLHARSACPAPASPCRAAHAAPPRRVGGSLLALVGLVIGIAGIVRVLFYKDPISD